jgi:tetratricopeptide (TPR) repeat protein
MKRCSYFLLFFVLTCTQNLLSQNINGFKIYVSKKYTTTLYFHDACSKYNFSETNCPFKFNALLSDEKSIALDASDSVAEPYTLHVTEGGRRHIFIVQYKSILEDSERDVYFTDLNKLTEISKTASNVPISPPPQKTEPLKTETQAVVKSTDTDSAENAETKYRDLVKRANDAFSSNKLDDALKYYTAALAMKPDEIYLNNQVQVIQKKIDAAKIEEEARLKDSSFKSYIDAGDKLLNDKLYSSAKIAYNEALKIKPGDVIVLQRLQAINKNIIADSLKAEQQKKEDLYANYLSLGDSATLKKSYGPAKIAYEQALLVKPNDAVARARLNSLNGDIVKDSLDAVNQNKAALYTSYINAADKAFNAQSFGVANSGYDSALTVKPGDTYATNQIKEINSVLAEQQRQAQRDIEQQKNEALQKQYTDLINKADQEYNSEMYEEALQDYGKALEVNKNDQYSKNKINQIKSVVSAKKLKLKQDSANNVKYVTMIKKADDAFNLKDYTNAKSFYKNALTYRSDDEYSNNRIAEIEQILTEEVIRKQAAKDSLDKINEVNQKYAKLISDAQKAYDLKDYTSARIMFSEASGLKPDETGPKNKLAAIDSELAETARVQAIQNKSDSLIANGEIAIATQQFPIALDNFRDAKALNLPEQQHYLQMQINYVQDQLNIIERQRQSEELHRTFDTAMKAYKTGKDSLPSHNYAAVLFYYKKFLSIVDNMDSATLESGQYNLSGIIKYVKTEVANIENELAKASVATGNKDTSHVITPKVYGSYAPTIYYPIQKDPGLNYVIKKYPDIDFYSSPPEQHFDSLLNYSIQSNLIGREIMSYKPDLDLKDSSSGIKLICQNIIFRNGNVYLKLLIQNYDSLEFLTGRMLLSYKSHNMDSVKLYPNYVANYPIVLGGRQKVTVYVAKVIPISDDGNLRFEMIDRLNKLRFIIDIPGAIYNREQKDTEALITSMH